MFRLFSCSEKYMLEVRASPRTIPIRFWHQTMPNKPFQKCINFLNVLCTKHLLFALSKCIVKHKRCYFHNVSRVLIALENWTTFSKSEDILGQSNTVLIVCAPNTRKSPAMWDVSCVYTVANSPSERHDTVCPTGKDNCSMEHMEQTVPCDNAHMCYRLICSDGSPQQMSRLLRFSRPTKSRMRALKQTLEQTWLHMIFLSFGPTHEVSKWVRARWKTRWTTLINGFRFIPFPCLLNKTG